ncbi:MAG TPA: endo alpha-1,4 polygalactosaminidase, partial [bacterium]|nr:endo alpha-1,4 polygalactosaminidase [bacterium]
QAYVNFDSACGGCLLGKPVAGFREERWVDVDDDRGQRTFLLGVIGARVDRCRADGFDAVEFDNVDGYSNSTGLSFSEAAQLLFDTALANLAHSKGLTVGLKNDLGQIGELLPYFDFAINEQCQQFSECSTLDPFVSAGKPVFQVEYDVGAGTVCPAANGANRNAILKSVDLFDVPWTPCR